MVPTSPETVMKMPTYHAIILATNDIGRINLYRLVSLSHLTYYNKRPRVPKSEFVKYRLENDNSKKERRRQIIENNGGRVEKFGLSYPVKNSESEIVTFQNAIRKKMEKLSLYRSRGFKTLGLFIFYDEPPIPIKIELLKECFDQVLNEYNDKYDFLYFGYSCGLVYYDIVNSDIQVKIIDRSDYDKLMYAARVKTDI